MCKYHSTAVTHVAPIQVSECELTSIEQVTDRFHGFNLIHIVYYVLFLVLFINSAMSKLHALSPLLVFLLVLNHVRQEVKAFRHNLCNYRDIL